jgi:hypothetical protein
VLHFQGCCCTFQSSIILPHWHLDMSGVPALSAFRAAASWAGWPEDWLQKAQADRARDSRERADGVAAIVDVSAFVYQALKSKRIGRGMRTKHLYLLAKACAPEGVEALAKMYVPFWDGPTWGCPYKLELDLPVSTSCTGGLQVALGASVHRDQRLSQPLSLC